MKKTYIVVAHLEALDTGVLGGLLQMLREELLLLIEVVTKTLITN